MNRYILYGLTINLIKIKIVKYIIFDKKTWFGGGLGRRKLNWSYFIQFVNILIKNMIFSKVHIENQEFWNKNDIPTFDQEDF
jgi:hypothetical protein